jgi:hypothetical protein
MKKVAELGLALLTLLLAACGTLEAGIESAPAQTPTVAPSSKPSEEVKRATLVAPTVVSTADWRTHEFPDLGIRLKVPRAWAVTRQPGTYLTGPGLDADNSTSATWLHFSVNKDVPQSLPELTRVMTAGMKNVAHISDFSTATMNVGGYGSLAIWWTQNGTTEHYLEVYVPAYGAVHDVVFNPPLLQTDGQSLTPIGQAILDSIEFFVPS